jgi:hypothetical protein
MFVLIVLDSEAKSKVSIVLISLKLGGGIDGHSIVILDISVKS